MRPDLTLSAEVLFSRAAQLFQVNLEIPENKMSYAPNSVEIQKFKKFHIPKISTKKINLITVARYSPKKKGYDTLLDICKMLLDRNIDFEWKIIGKGTEELLKNEIINSNLNKFKIINNIENSDETYFPNSSLIKHYVVSDIYVNLSRIESFGITFIESLASMVPVITLDTKGANEIVLNDINGFVVKNEVDLVKKIEEIYSLRKLIDDMRGNLLESIKTYDLNLVENNYRKLNYNTFGN